MEEKNYQEIVRNLLETRQYTKLRELIADMQEVDVALVMGEMKDEDSLKLFRLLPKDMAAEVFANLESDDQQYIIRFLSDRETSNIVNNLYADDAADFLEEMPANVVKRILAHANPETRKDINQLLQYPDDSAGSIMTVEYVDLKKDMTIGQAIERIRRIGLDSETVNICYVLDERRKLIGTVELRDLILSKPDALVRDVMNENFISVNTHDDQEEVAQAFQKYDCTAMPVVDKEHRLVGIITIDDIVDIIEQEATEDIEMMAAITPTDKPYMKTSVFETWKKRIPWLLLLMISATFTGQIIQHYEEALGAYIVLTSFIPMLMDTGGNAGSQVTA